MTIKEQNLKFLSDNTDHNFYFIRENININDLYYFKCNDCGITIGIDNKNNGDIVQHQHMPLEYRWYKKGEINIELEKCSDVIIKYVII